jgi:hypothetical protein
LVKAKSAGNSVLAGLENLEWIDRHRPARS